MTRRALPLRIATPLLAVALALAGCSAKVSHTAAPPSSSATTAGSRSAPDNDPGRPGNQSLTWSPCDSDYECAKLKVPVDYADPGGKTLSLALVRIGASDPSQRIGSLLVNPGGPGGSGIDMAEGFPWPTPMRQRFDVIGFDPRGVGRSSPLDCHGSLAKMYDADPSPRTASQTATLLSRSRAFVDDCATKYRDLLPHLGTRDVARDMDRIRIALGEPKINYLGYSYGTSIGQEYADLFPTRIRAMVLDGVVKLGQPGLEAATSQGASFEKNLQAFEADCKSSGSCAIGPDPASLIARLAARIERAPIAAPSADRPLGPGEFQLGVGQALYSQDLWPTLSAGLARADHGDGSTIVDLADQYLQRKTDGTYPNGFEIYFAVSCLDWSWPHDPNAILSAGRAAAKAAPILGEGTVTDYVRCAYWPTPSQPLTPPKAVGSPPIVVVSTTNDPATPYADGVELAKLLPKGVLITHEGNGHTVYGQGNTCVDDAVNRYFLTLDPPTNGVVC